MTRFSHFGLGAVVGLVMGLSACVGGIEATGDDGPTPDAHPADAGPDQTALQQATIKEWSGCMTLDDFNTANMASAWGAVASTSVQRCAGCHNRGAEGFIANDDPAVMFKAISEQEGLLLKFFTVDSSAKKMIVNTAVFESVVGSSHPTHPRFNATTNPGMTALLAFHALASMRQAAHTCDAPRLVP